MMNLSLSGYGLVESDDNAMYCGTGNISIEYEKFNLTNSNTSIMSLSEFENKYQNLSSDSIIKEFRF